MPSSGSMTSCRAASTRSRSDSAAWFNGRLRAVAACSRRRNRTRGFGAPSFASPLSCSAHVSSSSPSLASFGPRPRLGPRARRFPAWILCIPGAKPPKRTRTNVHLLTRSQRLHRESHGTGDAMREVQRKGHRGGTGCVELLQHFGRSRARRTHFPRPVDSGLTTTGHREIVYLR